VRQKAYSLVEILIVIAVFAVLSIVSTMVIQTVLKNANKTQSQINVRENLGYVMSVIERQLQLSKGITVCPIIDPYKVDFTSETGVAASFVCENIGLTDPQVASYSGVTTPATKYRLTSSSVIIDYCNFSCTHTLGQRDLVKFSISGHQLNNFEAEGATVVMQTEILLRNYSKY